MNKFYGYYKRGEKYILDLVGYDPEMKGAINPRTGRPTHFKTLKVIDEYEDEEKAESECRRLNLGIIEGEVV